MVLVKHLGAPPASRRLRCCLPPRGDYLIARPLYMIPRANRWAWGSISAPMLANLQAGYDGVSALPAHHNAAGMRCAETDLEAMPTSCSSSRPRAPLPSRRLPTGPKAPGLTPLISP